jgi:hypothetical protein
MFFIFKYKFYIKSKALAKNVVLKGSTMEQYEPTGEFNTTKKAATESKNSTQ